MKTKTKLIALLLCLAFVAAMATGCSSAERLQDKLSTDDYSVYTESEDDDGDDSDDGDDGGDTYIVDADIDDNYTPTASSVDITIEEQVLFDNAGIKVTALDYTCGDDFDKINIFVENDLDFDVIVSSDTVVINGFAVSGASFIWYVNAGQKMYDTIDLDFNEYEKKCIGDPGNIEIYMYACDIDFNDIFEEEYIQIKTSAYSDKNAEMVISNTEIVNKDGVKIGFMGVDNADYSEDTKYVYFYVENNTDRDITISTRDIAVNDTEVNALFHQRCPAGTKSITNMYLFEDDLENAGLDKVKIEKIEIRFKAYESTDDDDIFSTDTISLKIK